MSHGLSSFWTLKTLKSVRFCNKGMKQGICKGTSQNKAVATMETN